MSRAGWVFGGEVWGNGVAILSVSREYGGCVGWGKVSSADVNPGCVCGFLVTLPYGRIGVGLWYFQR